MWLLHMISMYSEQNAGPNKGLEDLSDVVESLNLTPEFMDIIRTEATQIQREIETGIRPAVAHARTLLWLDALAKLHSAAMEEAIENKDAEQASVWSRDLAALEYSLGLMMNIQPLTVEQKAEKQNEYG